MLEDDKGACFSLLAGGDYAQLVNDAFNPDKELNAGDIPWVIGGLTLVGHREEALGTYEGWASRLTPSQRVASRFFLGVSHCREGRYESARTIFLGNYREARRSGTQEDRFFACQGLAFYRYTGGRLHGAKVWADAAVRHAVGARFLYGTVLAFELRGHIQLNLGHIQAGFRSLQLARERAQALGQGALLQAMDVSILLYRSTYGISTQSDELVQLLEEAIDSYRFEDSYTHASLILALARLRLLQGKLTEARQLLVAASESVYHIDNHGLEMTYNLLLANLLRQQGETLQALSLVRGARHRAESHPDLNCILRACGLEAQLLNELGRNQDLSPLQAKIEMMTRKCGSLGSQRIRKREQGFACSAIRPGEDPLGDLIDQSVRFPSAALPAIIQSGWLSLLNDVLGIKRHEKVLFFDAEPGTLTIFNCGEITHRPEGCSGSFRKLMTILAKGDVSKEMMTIQLWAKAYSPLRDDRLIYALVAKSRRLLGTASEWIEVCELGYRLKSGVRVLTRNLQLPADSLPHKSPTHITTMAFDDLDDRLLATLNARQVTVLKWLRDGEVVEPRSMVERLHVSDATATRDLTGLVNLGLVRRMGRGRATRYFLDPITPDSEEIS